MEETSNTSRQLNKQKDRFNKKMRGQKISQSSTKELLKQSRRLITHQNKSRNSEEKSKDIWIDIKRSELHTKRNIKKTQDIFTSRTKERQERWKNTEFWQTKILRKKTKKLSTIHSEERPKMPHKLLSKKQLKMLPLRKLKNE